MYILTFVFLMSPEVTELYLEEIQVASSALLIIKHFVY